MIDESSLKAAGWRKTKEGWKPPIPCVRCGKPALKIYCRECGPIMKSAKQRDILNSERKRDRSDIKALNIETSSWFDRHPEMPEATRKQKDEEQRKIDLRAARSFDRCLTLEPPRKLSREEIRAIEHTITPVDMIPNYHYAETQFLNY